jgi:hypothetical protein
MYSVVMMTVFLVSSKFILTSSGWKENSACVCHDNFDSVKCIKIDLLFILLFLNACVGVKNCHKCTSIEVAASEGQFFLQTNLKFFSDNELYKLISPSICSYFLVFSIDEIEHSCEVPSQNVCFFHETLYKIHILCSLLLYQDIAIKTMPIQ